MRGEARLAFVLLIVILSSFSLARTEAPPSPLDPTHWGVVYDVPATREVTVRADVPYFEDAKGKLTVDLYLTPGMTAGEKRPAVVFLNAVGDRPGDKLKHWAIYRSWPRLVAAHGWVGISMDTDGERIQESLGALFRFLADSGGKHGIDGTRVGVYAASANVSGAMEYLMSERAAPGIRAAVLYYGSPPLERLRPDLPVLFVYAEGDLRGPDEELGRLWARVIETRAPWTLELARGLPHGFDALSDRDEARRVIQRTLAFWKSQLEPMPAPPWEPSVARSIVEAQYAHEPQRMGELVTRWLETHPEDATAHEPALQASIGQTYLAAGRHADAAEHLERAIAAGLRSSLIYGQLGYAQLLLRRDADAVRTYEAAFEAGIPPGPTTRGMAWYNLACGYARLGRTDKALEALASAAGEGFGNRAEWDSDPDLAPLRLSPRYREIVERLPPAPSS